MATHPSSKLSVMGNALVMLGAVKSIVVVTGRLSEMVCGTGCVRFGFLRFRTNLQIRVVETLKTVCYISIQGLGRVRSYIFVKVEGTPRMNG